MNSNTSVLTSLVLALCFWLTPAFVAPVQAAAPIELKIGHGQPTVHFVHRVMEAWAKKIEEETNGAVHFRIYPVGTLCPPLDIYEGLIKGIMDIGCAPEGFTPARFPLNSGATNCMLGVPSALAGSQIRMELWKRFQPMQDEFKDTHLLWLNTHTGANLHTSKPVRSLADLRGLQLRTPPGLPPWVTALGATPVVMPMPEAYEALQKGLVQGVFGTEEILKSFRLANVTKYSTQLRLYCGAFFVAMNKDTWNRLPQNVKDTIERSNEWGMAEFAKAYDEADASGASFAREEGNIFLDPNPELEADVYDIIKDKVHKNWAQQMDADGKPGGEILQELYKLVNEYK